MTLAREVNAATAEMLHCDFPVNVVFQILGEHLSIDFEGVRTGQYTRQDGLLVQAAVPREPTTVPVHTLRQLCVDAITVALDYRDGDRVAGDTAPLVRLRELLAQGWSGLPQTVKARLTSIARRAELTPKRAGVSYSLEPPVIRILSVVERIALRDEGQ